MARSVGDQIPVAIRPLLAGTDLAALEGCTFLLLTNTEGGPPHLAMLSVGELLQVGPRTLKAALWPGSTATRNLTRDGQATIALVHAGASYSLRCSGRRGEDLDLALAGRLASFDLTVVDATEDVAPYADLTSGVTFRLKESDKVLRRWQETIQALRELPSPD